VRKIPIPTFSKIMKLSTFSFFIHGNIFIPKVKKVTMVWCLMFSNSISNKNQKTKKNKKNKKTKKKPKESKKPKKPKTVGTAGKKNS
jgi:hypothetical protein